MSDDIVRMARAAGWSGLWTQWREPDGSADWTPVKESLIVPVTMEQIERFAALVAAADRQRIAEWVEDMCAGLDAKTIANGIRNGGNDAIEAFIKETT